MTRNLGFGLLVVAGMTLVGAASAQELPPLDMSPPGQGGAVPHGKHKAAARSPSSGSSRIWSDLVHGSAEQRAMEEEDDATAHRRPIDHSKDDFFSDWKGLK